MKIDLSVFCTRILDVSLLTVVGVNCEASVQPAHLQAKSAAPQCRTEARRKKIICLFYEKNNIKIDTGLYT
jgi:hypothetical protein